MLLWFGDIDIYLNSFLENFNNCEIVVTLFNELVKVQNVLNEYEIFWYIWKKFQHSVIKIAERGDIFYLIDKIIFSYLFSDHNILGKRIFPTKYKNWHSLKERDRRFFKVMSENIGHCPSSLYSFSVFLNGIGNTYVNDGICWIAYILNNNNFNNKKLVEGTIFNLENLTRNYIYENNRKIKEQNIVKKNILTILNFLVKKGSASSYMLRERVI